MLMVPRRMRAAPRAHYDGGAGGDADVDHGREGGFDAASVKGCLNRGLADEFQLLLLQVFAAEGLDDAHGFEALLNGGDDVALFFANFVSGLLYVALEAGNEEQQERSERQSDQCEVPVEPEHEADHADYGQQVHGDAECGGTGELLDGVHIVGDGAEHGAGLMRVVESERETLQMVVGAHAQVVSDPLADALRVVILNVGGERADGGDYHERDCGDGGQSHAVATGHEGFDCVCQRVA